MSFMLEEINKDILKKIMEYKAVLKILFEMVLMWN